jgi:ornithine cyclodeaminase
MRVLTDADVRRLSPQDAVSAMREMLRSYVLGTYLSPPRVSMTLGNERVLFSAGGSVDGSMALRVSGTAASHLEHLAVSWLPSGEIEAVIVGNEIGARRTGAVAAVAADLLARAGDVRVGLIGSGRNGWAQIWALTGARSIVDLAIFSPTVAHREAFAVRARTELGLSARPVASAEAATREMDIVILCTTSRSPVIESSWVQDGAHITSIGAKTVSAHEVPSELVFRLTCAASDAPGEIVAPITEVAGIELTDLGTLLAAEQSARGPEELSLFLYAGLGASDAYFAQAVVSAGA